MLTKRKGFDLLTDVIKMSGSRYNWKIAYNIIDSSYDKILSEIKMLDNVECFYQIKNEDMPSFYDGIDILVIPSRRYLYQQLLLKQCHEENL